jgi:hypothetical protein
VVVMVVPKRKASDESWEGDCLEPAFLCSSFTRATERCVIMTHVLNRMALPREGMLRTAALQLGVLPSRQEERLAGRALQKRLSWMRVCRQGQALWRGALQIPSAQGRIMHDYDWKPNLYFHCAPCFEQIRQSSEAGQRLEILLQPDLAGRLLAVCWDAATQALDEMQA